VWHDATANLEAAGRLRVAGIVQEQHPDRALLFMQWKGMGWPLMVDQLDLLEVRLVPITVLVDEHGIVRGVPGRGVEPSRVLEEFLAADFESPAELVAEPTPPARAPDVGPDAGPSAWRARADHLVRFGGPDGLDGAIEAYRRALEPDAADGGLHFRLGVAYRARHDGSARRPGDFQAAIDHWTRALAADPNQYIWRRRIQQYGPRLDKPYPFYDWVIEARKELRARGETPRPLVVEPRGAELAAPLRSPPERARPSPIDLDPEGRILRDPGELIHVETTVVPASVPPGGAVRLHVEMAPRRAVEAHWNNEAGDHVVTIEPPEGWQAEATRVVVPAAVNAISEEIRTAEIELRAPAEVEGRASLAGYTLYYVCQGLDGVCMYRRQDLQVEVSIGQGAPTLGRR
jgi:hypothetical protein